MIQVNIHEAKTHLSSLVKKAAQGEPFVIALSGRPMVTVVPYFTPSRVRSRTGFLSGEGSIPADFDEMCADTISALFGDGLRGTK
jgi:prevent-host-death family protein